MRLVILTTTTPAAAAPRRRPRRGVTLIEMLVTVALLVLVMSILVAIFQSATGAVDVQQKFTVIDQDLRRVESTLRSDLQGVTARLTPPLNPAENLGYFTYEENQFADIQGEDVDDVLAFTTKAPPGQPFVGRIWVPKSNADVNAPLGQTLEPTTITSDFAEVIYFVRSGNLYRRVLLVRPDLKETLGKVIKPAGVRFKIHNNPSDFAIPDPQQIGGFVVDSSGTRPPVSWMAFHDLSCRPPDLSGPPVPIPNSLGDLTNRHNRFATPRFQNSFDGDSIPDDSNGDGVPDYYPTLYPRNPHAMAGIPAPVNSYDIHGFPWMIPGMYSYPMPAATPQQGAIHDSGIGFTDPTGTVTLYNHAPLEFGESNAGTFVMPNRKIIVTTRTPTGTTWWGRPTWKETASVNWHDPWWVISPLKPTQSPPLSWDRLLAGRPLPQNLPLPPVLEYSSDPQAGANSNLVTSNDIWADDLLLSGVRSFDIKAYDDNGGAYGGVADYYDLGYGSISDPNLISSTPLAYFTPLNAVPAPHHEPREPIGFGHEGRMPPLVADFRYNPYFPFINGIANNIGHTPNNATQIILRLRRTFDTWSTDYTAAPSLPVNPANGPYGGNKPTLPSYPAPYPAPLRGIQIQIRAVDPTSQHIRTMTIRQDFANKL